MGFLIVYIIPFLVKSAVYLFMASLQLVYQVMALFYVLMAPIILLLSLVPSFCGIDLVSTWLKKILETQIMMLIINLMVGIVTKVDRFLYSMAPDKGWLIVIVIETILVTFLVLNYKDILSGIAKVTKAAKHPSGLSYQLRKSGDVLGAISREKSNISQHRGESILYNNMRDRQFSASDNSKEPNMKKTD